MSERKKRFLTIVPALSGMVAASLLVMPISSDVRVGLMGFCIGCSVVALVKLKRAQRC